jgi:hypothetical protein
VFVSAPSGIAVGTIVDLDGTHRRELGRVMEGECPFVARWAPRARLFTYSSNDTVTVAREDGTRRRALEPGCSPSPAPDGKRVAFTFGGELAVVGADDKHLRALDYERGNWSRIEVPVWSPDGRRIAYSKRRDRRGRWWTRLYVARGRGKPRPRFVTTLPDCSLVSELRWMPGGRRLFFSLGASGCEPGE